ncbi:MAG: hypothetical protein V7K48_34695 [Nostoc sp.]|uniref:hypothetical protein n=1 Tax=Nostoc sp. TaxID=1180 RepID=UPI002FFC716E
MLNNSPTNTFVNKFEHCINSYKSLVKNIATEIIPANKTRAYACFVNNSFTEITLILGNPNEGTINKGIVINPAGSYEITNLNLYLGKVSAISASDCQLSYVECSY